MTGPREIEGENCYEALFVLAGCFTLRDARGQVYVDPTTCVMGSPRQLAEVAHPAPGGDAYLHVLLSAEVWHDIADDEEVPLAASVSGPMRVAVRAIMMDRGNGVVDTAAEETAVSLVADAVAQRHPSRVAVGRPATDRRRRQLTEDARTVVLLNPEIPSVREVADRLDCSAYHLSRVFRAYTGMSLVGYRTQVRLNLALELLADGGTTISGVAGRCGFADQAHLTRALRQHTGLTPKQLRGAAALDDVARTAWEGRRTSIGVEK